MAKKKSAQRRSASDGKKQNFDLTVQRGNTAAIILVAVLTVLILVGAGLFVIWRMFFASSGYPTPREYPSQYAPPERPGITAKSNVDPALVGTWESDCLVPDPRSPWSEKHQFAINADGTAQHTRWSSGGHACAPETTMVDKYKIVSAANGKIEFSLLEGVGPAGQDIYKVTGNTLLFGHGFRNHYPYTENTLNEYIVYKKKN